MWHQRIALLELQVIALTDAPSFRKAPCGLINIHDSNLLTSTTAPIMSQKTQSRSIRTIPTAYRLQIKVKTSTNEQSYIRHADAWQTCQEDCKDIVHAYVDDASVYMQPHKGILVVWCPTLNRQGYGIFSLQHSGSNMLKSLL